MSKAIVIDTETTQKDEPEIIETSYMPMNCRYEESTQYGVPVTARWKPEGRITFGAMAVHHIVETDLVNCPPSNTFKLPPDVEYAVGHNVDFDMKAIIISTGANLDHIKRIDTLAMARKVWPDADSHTVGGLSYFLRGESVRAELRNAHSAEADIILLSVILDKIMEHEAIYDMEELYVFSEKARIPETITFGKHAGTKVVDLPLDYKGWMLGKADTFDPYLIKAIQLSLEPKPAKP